MARGRLLKIGVDKHRKFEREKDWTDGNWFADCDTADSKLFLLLCKLVTDVEVQGLGADLALLQKFA